MMNGETTKVEGKQVPEEITLDDEEEDDFEVEYVGDVVGIGATDTLSQIKINLDSVDHPSAGVTVGGGEHDLGKECTVNGHAGPTDKGDIVDQLIGDCMSLAAAHVVIDLEEEEEDEEEEVLSDGTTVTEVEIFNEAVTWSRKALEEFLVEFRFNAGNGRPKKIREKVERGIKKVRDEYLDTQNLNNEAHLLLREEIECKRQSMKAVPGSAWAFLKDVKDLLQPSVMNKISAKSAEERLRNRQMEKAKLIKKFEKEIRKLNKQIKKLEETEVDWNDDENDHNSSYILTEKYKLKIMRAFYSLCDLSECSRFTDRPTQKRINVKKSNSSSNYDEIDSALETMVNKGGSLFIPDFADVHETIKIVNSKKALGIAPDAELQLAQEMFRKIVLIIKSRRTKDFRMNMLARLPRGKDTASSAVGQPVQEESGDDDDSPISPPPADDNMEQLSERFQDPALLDPELLRKLEENDKLKKSEDEIIQEFVRRAEQGFARADVDEDTNDTTSPPASDNEAQDDDEEEEEGSSEEIREHQFHELLEEEDEEPNEVSSWTVSTAGTSSDDKTPVASHISDTDNLKKEIIINGTTEGTPTDNISEVPLKPNTEVSEAPSKTKRGPDDDDVACLPPKKKIRADEDDDDVTCLD